MMDRGVRLKGQAIAVQPRLETAFGSVSRLDAWAAYSVS